MAQLPKVPQIENGKPNFSPTFQKVELRNSTFFQQFYNSPYLEKKVKFFWVWLSYNFDLRK